MKKKFLRRDSARFSKFGKRRKKILGWRKPKGRDNKMREKRKGYAPVVSIGYSSDKDKINKIKEKTPIMINNVKDLEKLKKNSIGIVGNVGKKKKSEIAKRAKEMKVELYNLNPELTLKKIEKKENLKEGINKNETK